MPYHKFKSRERRFERNLFYASRAWRRIRAVQLRKAPLCAICRQNGFLTVATVCDHISPLWETWEEFMSFPLQSLCPAHHSEKSGEDIAKRTRSDKLKITSWE